MRRRGGALPGLLEDSDDRGKGEAGGFVFLDQHLADV